MTRIEEMLDEINDSAAKISYAMSLNGSKEPYDILITRLAAVIEEHNAEILDLKAQLNPKSAPRKTEWQYFLQASWQHEMQEVTEEEFEDTIRNLFDESAVSMAKSSGVRFTFDHAVFKGLRCPKGQQNNGWMW